MRSERAFCTPSPSLPSALSGFRLRSRVIVHHRKRSHVGRRFQDPSDCPYFTAAASSSSTFPPLLSLFPFLISSPLLQTSSPPPTPPSLPNQIMISPFPSPPAKFFCLSPPTKGFLVQRFAGWLACVRVRCSDIDPEGCRPYQSSELPQCRASPKGMSLPCL